MWSQHRVARVSFALLLQRSKALPGAADLITLYMFACAFSNHGQTLQERFLPTRPLARLHTPNSTRACIRLSLVSRAGQPNTHVHRRARALADSVHIRVLYAFTVHAMLQAIIHRPGHSHHPSQPNVHHRPPTTSHIAHNTQRAHAKLRVPLSIPHGRSPAPTIPLAQPHSEIDL